MPKRTRLQPSKARPDRVPLTENPRIYLTSEELLEFWKALQKKPKLTASQQRLARLMQGLD